MRKLMLGLLAASPLVAGVCLAQANAINIYCETCRDPNEFPNDYANFAFNQIYGPDAWLSFEQADDFFITNAAGQKVYVDVDFVMMGFNFRGFHVPFWPRYVLRITLALPNGMLLAVFRSVFQTSLPVPASPDGPDPDTTSGAAGPDGSGDEEDEGQDDHSYEDEFDWDDVEIDGYEGSTWIEDPDEYGDFDDAEWCEEC